VGLASLLRQAWSGISGSLRPPTAARLFRRADQCRTDGRYEEAGRLLAQGLIQAPDSSVGHLLSAYLHVALRETDLARTAFHRVLALDPQHPRALLGLARIAIEQGNLEDSTGLLNRALHYYPEFPEARALRDMLLSWPSPEAGAAKAPKVAPARDPDPGGLGRDLVMSRTDGTLVFAKADQERARLLAQHMTQVYRMASATLARAGLGPLRRGAIEAGSGTTFLLSDRDRILSVTFDGNVEVGAGFVQIGRLWTELGVDG
jgi:tetratricopeptide (TPR) repeat protein